MTALLFPSALRPAAAQAGIFGNNAGEAVYPMTRWLPAPDGPVYLVMRLYWPQTDPPSILPPGEGTWVPPAVQKAN